MRLECQLSAGGCNRSWASYYYSLEESAKSCYSEKLALLGGIYLAIDLERGERCLDWQNWPAVEYYDILKEGGKEGGREEGREGGRKGGREGGREGRGGREILFSLLHKKAYMSYWSIFK